MTNRAYDWVAEGEREERSRLRAERRSARRELTIRIVTWIAEGHGGSLTLENRQDRPGCVARLTLPRTA